MSTVSSKMTTARAKEVMAALRQIRTQGASVVTSEEDTEIKAFWETLPGNTSYFGAVCAMAKGKHL